MIDKKNMSTRDNGRNGGTTLKWTKTKKPITASSGKMTETAKKRTATPRTPNSNRATTTPNKGLARSNKKVY